MEFVIYFQTSTSKINELLEHLRNSSIHSKRYKRRVETKPLSFIKLKMKISFILFFAVFFKHATEQSPIPSFILNGQEAEVGEFPHQLMLQERYGYNWKLICSASLINSQQALTAAHCITEVENKNLRIVAGLHDLGQDKDFQIVMIKEKVIHANYKDGSATSSNDIAVLTFSEPLKLNARIQAIAWNQHENITFVGHRCVLSGWGRMTNGEYPEALQKVTTDIISNDECGKKMFPYEYQAVIYAGHICAYGAESGSCTKDSGSAMTCQLNGDSILAGITSWGIKDYECNSAHPSVYSRLSYFKSFILDNIIS